MMIRYPPRSSSARSALSRWRLREPRRQRSCTKPLKQRPIRYAMLSPRIAPAGGEEDDQGQVKVAARRERAGRDHRCLARDDRDDRVEHREQEDDAVRPRRVRDQIEEASRARRRVHSSANAGPRSDEPVDEQGAETSDYAPEWKTTTCSTRSTCAPSSPTCARRSPASDSPRGGVRGDPARGSPSCSPTTAGFRKSSRRLPRKRDGRRDRAVAALPRGDRQPVAVQPGRSSRVGDARPRPSRLGPRRPLPRHPGGGGLRPGGGTSRAARAPTSSSRATSTS